MASGYALTPEAVQVDGFCAVDMAVADVSAAIASFAGPELHRRTAAPWSRLAHLVLTGIVVNRLRAIRGLGKSISWAVLCEGLPDGMDAEMARARACLTETGPGTPTCPSGACYKLSHEHIDETIFVRNAAEQWLSLPDPYLAFLRFQISRWLANLPPSAPRAPVEARRGVAGQPRPEGEDLQ